MMSDLARMVDRVEVIIRYSDGSTKTVIIDEPEKAEAEMRDIVGRYLTHQLQMNVIIGPRTRTHMSETPADFPSGFTFPI